MHYPVSRLLLATLIWLLGVLLPGTAAGDTPPPPATTLEVFVREGCPHCADAKAYLEQLTGTRPALRIRYRSLDHDPLAPADLERVSREAGLWPPGVPTFVANGQVLVGFGSAAESAPAIEALLSAGEVLPAEGVETQIFGRLTPDRMGLPVFTLAIGLIDGFNPCATWVLLFLLSLLVRLRDRRRMALVAGTFVLVSGAVYYAFLAAWLTLFLAVGASTPLRWALGSLALFIGIINTRDALRGNAFTIAIPEDSKPALFARMRRVMNADKLPAALLGVSLLALAVNFIELLCTAGLPAIYTAILARQMLDPLAYHAYLALYIAAYIADDTLMVAIAVIALSSSKLTEAGGRWLKLLAGLVMLLLGAAMLLRPEMLGQ